MGEATIGGEMRALRKLVRRRFAGADVIRYGHAAGPLGDTVLWQVLAGDEVLWDAGPAVEGLIPRWERLSDVVELMTKVIPADVEGDWLVLQLP